MSDRIRDPIRIGIIGMGSMGKGLLYQSHITPGIECVAVCDIDVQRCINALTWLQLPYQVVTNSNAMDHMAALDGSLEVFDGLDLVALRAKSIALTGLFIELVESGCAGRGIGLVTPRDPAHRGSHVSLAHPEGYGIMQALIARGVTGDFRAPDVLRFGFPPLYTRFVHVWDAVEALVAVLDRREWDRPEHRRRRAVT